MASVRVMAKRKGQANYESWLVRSFAKRFVGRFWAAQTGDLLRQQLARINCGLSVAFRAVGEQIAESIKKHEKDIQERIALQRAGVLCVEPDRQGDPEAWDHDC